ncbi:hypothetical protein [Nocardiopsis alkaliphila]|uniref:hypothetical protein n=1 Tax=Nocardiopsis alkaliphila TaxID=225762 RepID=UPI00034AF6E4|nr:hypothetical protein [Nocardiopsis alkaliphila]
MSPKKRKRHKPNTHTPPQGTEPGRVPPGTTPRKRPLQRTPVVVPSPPDRRITALWVILWLLWALGTPLALAALLFAGLDTGIDPADPRLNDPETAPALLHEHQQQTLRTIGNALLWLLAMAWAVPGIGTIAALLLRRKMAAIAFATALTLSVISILLLAPPGELLNALTTHLFG